MVAGRNDLVVGLELDSRDLSRGLTKASNDIRRFDRTASRGFGRANRGLLELSRGAEDFAVSFGTGGLAGGFRGAANNISQFASMIHPLAGAVAGLGVAAASMWLAFGKGAKDAKKETKDFSKELELTRANIKKGLGEISFKRLGQQGPEGMESMSVDQIDSRRKEIDKRLQGIRDEFSVSQREAARILAPQGITEGDLGFEQGIRVSDTLKAVGKSSTDLTPRQSGPLLDIEKKNTERRDERQRLTTERRKLTEQRGETLGRDNRAVIADERGRFNRRREEEERLRDAELRERYRGRQGGTLNVLGQSNLSPQAQPPAATPAGLASIATKGSAGAARAIAEAKNQSNIQKSQLDELKAIKESLKETSQTAQADVIIESFSGVA